MLHIPIQKMPHGTRLVELCSRAAFFKDMRRLPQFSRPSEVEGKGVEAAPLHLQQVVSVSLLLRVLEVTGNLWFEAVNKISATTVVMIKRSKFLMAKSPFLDELNCRWLVHLLHCLYTLADPTVEVLAALHNAFSNSWNLL